MLVFVLNVFSADFPPVFEATIPDIVTNQTNQTNQTDQTEHTKALSLSRLAFDLESLLSPMLAAALIAIMTFGVLLLMNGVALQMGGHRLCSRSQLDGC